MLSIALLPLRLALGIIMVAHHGHQQVFGEAKEQFPGAVQLLGVPKPTIVARVVSNLEFFGGLALIAGLFTRLAALFAWIVSRMKWDKGMIQGYEFGMTLLAGFVSLVLSGGGSLDDVLFGGDRDERAHG